MENWMEELVDENIEMELFSVQTQGEDTARPQWSSVLHPLAQHTEEKPRVTQGSGSSRTTHTLSDLETPTAVEELLIEMEALQSMKKSTKSTSVKKEGGLKWKKLPPQKSRFEVKDMVFLPRDQYMAQIESLVFSKRREVTAVRARMTVDHSWSSSQMDSRLRLVLKREFGKTAARRIHFTYLQCVQSSRSLFVPSAPTDGWSGSDVLRISALGPIYVLIQQDPASSQVKHEPSLSQSEDHKKKLFQDNNDLNRYHRSRESSEELRKELQTTLTPFTQQASGVELPLQVRRGAVLPSALKAIRRSDFCFRNTPIISFCGEETEGHEGPLREFFRLMLQELMQTSLFEGQPGRLLLTFDPSALEDWRYYEAGLLIGWSLAHGGAGPRCLHPALFQLMCGQGLSLVDFSWRDVPDIEVQSHLLQLESCSDVKLLSPGLCEWASSCGVSEISSLSAEGLPNIYTRLLQYYIHDRVSRAVSQLTQGLNSCGGLWDVMRTHWEAFVPVMTSSCSEPLTLESFKELFTVSFSPDSEEQEKEQETVTHWETVLNHIRDGEAPLSFEDLLVFITGVDHVPPLRFSSPISLCFYSQDAVLSSVRLPFASSCALELFLPVDVGGAAELMQLLTRSVQESQGFTHLNKDKRGK